MKEIFRISKCGIKIWRLFIYRYDGFNRFNFEVSAYSMGGWRIHSINIRNIQIAFIGRVQVYLNRGGIANDIKVI